MGKCSKQRSKKQKVEYVCPSCKDVSSSGKYWDNIGCPSCGFPMIVVNKEADDMPTVFVT